jgi:hypothetical protein
MISKVEGIVSVHGPLDDPTYANSKLVVSFESPYSHQKFGSLYRDFDTFSKLNIEHGDDGFLDFISDSLCDNMLHQIWVIFENDNHVMIFVAHSNDDISFHFNDSNIGQSNGIYHMRQAWYQLIRCGFRPEVPDDL